MNRTVLTERQVAVTARFQPVEIDGRLTIRDNELSKVIEHAKPWDMDTAIFVAAELAELASRAAYFDWVQA
jgi:hypothetical protein